MSRGAPDVYDHRFEPDNVYGHALALLARFGRAPFADKLHLDIGCGFGRLAEPLVAATGLQYVGLDRDEAGLRSLRERGFEAHQGTLGDEAGSIAWLGRVIGERKVGAITFLDTIEHLVDGDAVLRAIAHIARGHGACVVVSTPNVAHRDIGSKLALGRWQYTGQGLLDHTHLHLYSNEGFVSALRRAGLHVVDADDVRLVRSDQHFPLDHPALSEATLLGDLLGELRQRADAHGDTNQFVRLCIAGPRVDEPAFAAGSEPGRPFLTALVRTQGTRIHTLVEALTCLAGQTSDDFEVVVVGHRLTREAQLAVERTLEDSAAWLRERIRLLRVEDGNRTRPLNVGFAAARGRYIAILDDDDAPLAHWVATFRELALKAPGRVLRTVAVRQDVRNVVVNGRTALRAEGKFDRIYPPAFDLFQHLAVNQSPPVGLAFPRGVYHELSLRFDESLATTEDWDYLMRCAALVGVASSPKITAIYRWWTADESSRTVHPPSEWYANHHTILRKQDETLFLYPRGTTARIRELMGGPQPSPTPVPVLHPLQEQLLRHLMSSSWKVSAPLRWLGRAFGARKLRYDFGATDPEALRAKIRVVRRSFSWRITKPLRRRRNDWWDQDP